nr:cysteine-rich repeat secretory protein 3 [Ipomoea trifida]
MNWCSKDVQLENPRWNWVFSQNLDALFEALVSQSSAAKFYKIAAAGPVEHHRVVPMSGRPLRLRLQRLRAENRRPLCGDSIAGRVHRAVQILASRTRAALQALRVTALGEIAKGVETGNRFYTDDFESVFVSAVRRRFGKRRLCENRGGEVKENLWLRHFRQIGNYPWRIGQCGLGWFLLVCCYSQNQLSRKRPIPKYNMEDKDQ